MSSRRVTRITLAAGFLILLIIVAGTVWLVQRNQAYARLATQSLVIENQIAAIQASVLRAETGQRGFLLTGDLSYLEPYGSALGGIGTQLDALQEALTGNPEQQRRVDELREATAAKLAELRETVEKARADDFAGAKNIVTTDRGQALMGRVTQLLEEMRGAEETIAERRVAEERRSGAVLIGVDLLGAVVVILLASFVLHENRRSTLILRHAQDELAAMNATLEQRVQERSADLREANEEVQRFAYVVSHDLRAPLVNIMGFSGEIGFYLEEIARYLEEIHASHPELRRPGVEKTIAADLPEALRYIENATAKMDRLISAILKLSREGSRLLKPQPVDMRKLVTSTADSLRHTAESRQATITIGELPDTTSDALVLEQVFTNLLDNALKYLHPGRAGLIVVSGRREGQYVVYEVEDNGRGIAERDRERIFELFRRAGPQDQSGEGIGLAHVRALVRRLGGSIACRSVLNEGTVFSLRLPYVLELMEKL